MRMKVILWLITALAALVFSSCPLESDGPETYERIVIDTYGLFGGYPQTDVDLYDETGTLLGSDTAAAFEPGRIDTDELGINLSSGTYYIKVYDNDQTEINPYAVRALSLAVGETLPGAVAPPGGINSTDTPYEPDDAATGNIPTDPVEITLGNNLYLNRYLGDSTVPDPIDDDWLKLVLP